jgi:hypothetical protein
MPYFPLLERRNAEDAPTWRKTLREVHPLDAKG